MGLFSALQRKPLEEDMYDEYDDQYAYEDEQSWEGTDSRPIQSAADMRVVVVEPKEYNDAPRVADHLRDMKFVVLNLSKTDHDVARRLLDFVSGVVFSEDGHIMKVATNVYVVAPYFVELMDLTGQASHGGDVYF